MKIISCNSNINFARNVAKLLGLELVKANIKRFQDKEVFVEIIDTVRGSDVYVVQSTSDPANDHIMELLITIDALKRASAKSVTAVIPYFGYARQDRQILPRTPITAKLVANLITTAGVDRVVTIDLHAGQIQGFFDLPVDNLYASPIFIKDIKETYKGDDITIVSPDVGGVARARYIAKRLNTDLAIIDKRREKAGVSEVMNVIGDVVNKNCILIDDIVDSAGTLCNAAVSIMEKGAKSVSAYITHGVLSGEAMNKIHNSPLTSLITTDTINQLDNKSSNDKLRIVSMAPLMAEAIKRISEGLSISSLFE